MSATNCGLRKRGLQEGGLKRSVARSESEQESDKEKCRCKFGLVRLASSFADGRTRPLFAGLSPISTSPTYQPLFLFSSLLLSLAEMLSAVSRTARASSSRLPLRVRFLFLLLGSTRAQPTLTFFAPLRSLS